MTQNGRGRISAGATGPVRFGAVEVVEERQPGPGEVGEIIETSRRRSTGPADWSFARRPKWILSHLFALTLIVSFVGAGFWQLDRLDQRQASNSTVEERALAAPVPVESALFGVDLASGVEGDTADQLGLDLDFVAVTAVGRFIDPELARVANRSQDGRGGDWVVSLFETVDGDLLVVNRGFVLRSESVAPTGDEPVTIDGFLRRTRTKGWIGSDDDPSAERMPRLNVADVVVRAEADGVAAEGRTVPLWFQLAAVDGQAPDLNNPAGEILDAEVVPRPVPLDDLGEGNHFSYAVQWFSLAALSVLIYSLMLRRIARR